VAYLGGHIHTLIKFYQTLTNIWQTHHENSIYPQQIYTPMCPSST